MFFCCSCNSDRPDNFAVMYHGRKTCSTCVKIAKNKALQDQCAYERECMNKALSARLTPMQKNMAILPESKKRVSIRRKIELINELKELELEGI